MHEPLPRRGAAAVTHNMHRDFETCGKANLAKVGVHKYAADPSTTIWCAAYAVNNDPVKLWFPGDPVPPEWTEAAHNPSWRLTAHNDPFESAIEQHILGHSRRSPAGRCSMNCLRVLTPGEWRLLPKASEIESRSQDE